MTTVSADRLHQLLLKHSPVVRGTAIHCLTHARGECEWRRDFDVMDGITEHFARSLWAEHVMDVLDAEMVVEVVDEEVIAWP